MNEWIVPAFWCSLAVFSVGFLSQLWTLLGARSARGIHVSESSGLPANLGLLRCLRESLAGSWTRFHFRSSRTWCLGCLCYHGAIFLVAGTCAAAILSMILFPSARPSQPGIHATALWVVSCAGPEESVRIFGPLAPLVRTLSLVELPLAVTGNVLLLVAYLRGHHGRIGRGLDAATAGLWIAGRRRASQLVVRLTITAIIATEFLGRTGTRPWAVSLHVLLALWLAGILPFTHLRHVLWSPLALWFAWRRRIRLAIA